MKNVLIAVLLMISASSVILIFSLTKEYNAMVFEYEQEARVQHEYWKACDATRMYLENIVEQNGIENRLK